GGARCRRAPRPASSARAPGAAGGRLSAAPVFERGGAPKRTALEAATSPPLDFADGVDRPDRGGRGAAAFPHAGGRGVAAPADGARCDLRQLGVVRARGGWASRARAPESRGTRVAGARDG